MLRWLVRGRRAGLLLMGWLAAGVSLTVAPTSGAAETLADLPPQVALAARSLGLAADGISIYVQDVNAAEPQVSFNADVPRNPASTLKLVTSFAALERLGPAYTWKTEVFVSTPPVNGRVGDLWVRGYGDPYFVSEEYWKLADALAKRGLNRIQGDLVFDTSFFELPPEDRARFDNQPNRVYNLPPHPLLVNFNAVRFLVRPGADGRSVSVAADPPLPNLHLENRLRLHKAPCGGYQRGVALAVEDPGNRDQVLLEGRFPAGCSEYAITRTVLQPESYAFGLFELYWRQLGGSLDGSWRIGEVPLPDGTRPALGAPFHVHHSRPLGDLIRLVNKYSNNVMTRHLELTLGAETFGAPATPEKGMRAIFELLSERGVDVAGLKIDNSAGLSRETRISARQLAGVLHAGWHSPFMPEFVSSLSIAGLDGTMRRRLAGTPGQGRMHLKTGSLNDVSAIAGYVLTRTGKRFLVVALINAPEAHRGLGEDLQDVVLRWVLDR